MIAPGFLAVYRWTVASGYEAAFEAWWRDGTEELKAHGSFGSTLIREAHGSYVGVALWPDAATRAAAFAAWEGSSPAPRVVDVAELANGAISDMLWAL